MAEHLWFIPVTGGSSGSDVAASFPIAPTRDLTNVQWFFSVYPVGQEPPVDTACLSYSSITSFSMGQENDPGEPSKLVNCYGHWAWRSCEQDNNIVTGGQLAVGTVFSRLLEIYQDGIPDPGHVGPDVWDMVEAWVKFRINAANINMFDNVFFTINDSSAPPNVVGLNNMNARDWLGTIGPGGLNNWFVAYAFKVGNWEGWESYNLRAVLSAQGTRNPANVGPVSVDVEWFAFRLSEETPPH